ncbi:MAG: tetratricopeptide repeat protein [Treponema sp.]|nr:tetratricopeptide repeat protein [Treponema sp.]
MKNIFKFLILSSFFLVSCASSSLMVPGESKIILKNIAVEYNTIADGYLEIKNYAKAAQYYKLAMRNEDLYLTAYYKLARSYALAKDWENADKTYRELLLLDSENNMLKTSLAYITVMRGETDEGILMYRDLIKENPYDENLLESYVSLLINVGRGEDAEESFFVLKEKFPDNKQISTFAQSLSEIVDNFNPDKNTKESPKD